MQLLRRQQTMIGLDIGSSTVKAVKMVTRGKKYIFDAYAIERMEEGAIQGGEVKKPAAVAAAAKAVVARCDRAARDVVIALPNDSVLSDVFTLELMPKKNIREAVMVEASRLSPFDMSEVQIDYAVIERNEEAKQMKVLMAAAKNDLIYTYLDCLNEAGLRVNALDVDLFAIMNMFLLNYDPQEFRSSMIVNIGMESTDAAFLLNGLYHSSREIPVAGAAFQNALSMASGLPADRLHRLLNGAPDPDVKVDEVSVALTNSVIEFANAVGVAVSYFQSADGVERIDRVLLTGGFASVPGLANSVELRTGAEVTVLDPFVHVECRESLMNGIDRERTGALLAVAMGLATRTA